MTASSPAALLADAARLARWRILAIFFINAFVGAHLNMRIPDLQLRAGLSEGELGLVLMGAPIGGLGVFAIATRVVEAIGTRRLILGTFPLLALSAALVTATDNATIMFAALVANGCMGSLSNLAINVEADRIEAATHTRVMNRCHGLWSIGFFLSGLIAGALRGAGVDPALHLWGLVPAYAAFTLALALPMVEAPARQFAGEAKRVLFAWPSLAVVALVAFGVGPDLLEAASKVWATIYLRDAFDVPVLVESAAAPALVLTMAAGRLAADRWIDRHGARRIAGLALATTLAGLMMVVVTSNPYVAILGFAISGLGASVVYPLMLSSAARLGDRPAAQNVAAVTLVIQVVMLLAPMLIGAIAEASSVRTAFACLLPLVALGLAMSRFVR